METAAWSPLAKGLLAFWNEKRGIRPMPARHDIDPLEMKPWLSRLMLIEVIDAGRDFRYRLVGTDVVTRIGRDMTGKLISQLPALPEIVGRFLEEYRQVVRSGRPGYAVHDYFSPTIKRTIKFERLLLPLGEADGPVGMLLGLRNDLMERS